MFYRSEKTRDPSTIVVDELGGTQLRDDIKHLTKLIINDNQNTADGDQDESQPLMSESFVIAIHGGWGTGKTWASWAFINHLKTQDGFNDRNKFHVFAFDLLPFASISESIDNILGSIANNLWSKGVVDAREELRQMAIDATPTQEVSAGLQLFGITLSRKFYISGRYKQNKDALKQKFRRLTQNGHRFLIMLDDLDRMKPDEMVIVLRMVENFKDIPGIIFVLPFHKDAVTGAIHESLKLNNDNSHVFLRKFIKASITINLSVQDLKDSFIEEFTPEGNDDLNQKAFDQFGMQTRHLTWYTLLHMLIVRDTIAAIGSEKTGNNSNDHFGNKESSEYLYKLSKFLRKARKPSSHPDVSSLPYADGGKYKRFADVYAPLSERRPDAGVRVERLESLLNTETLTDKIYTDQYLVDELRKKAEIDYTAESSKMHTGSETVFEAVVLRNIQGTENEPKLTKVYSRRDMIQLAKAVRNDPNFSVDSDPTAFIKRLITIIYARFMEFR